MKQLSFMLVPKCSWLRDWLQEGGTSALFLPFYPSLICPNDVGPSLPLDFSYYSYEYEVDPYASEGDTFELTTASSTAAQDSDSLRGAAMTNGE